MPYSCHAHHTICRYILETSKILHEKYNDDIPTTLEEMMALRGGTAARCSRRKRP